MKTLMELLEAPTENMLGIVHGLLLAEGRKPAMRGEKYLYYENRRSPLLLSAHIDTVTHREEVWRPYRTGHEGNVIRSTAGILGADDRAGVFAIIKIAQHLEDKSMIPNMIFTDEEECGGHGMDDFMEDAASKRHLSKYRRFNHIRLAVAIDRKGVGEYVKYNYLPPEVEKYVESFGFHDAYGTFNDIEIFSSESSIPSVNVSAGYYRQHTENEELHVDELILTMRRVLSMIKDPIDALYPIPADKKGRWKGNSYNACDWIHGVNSYVWKRDEKGRWVKGKIDEDDVDAVAAAEEAEIDRLCALYQGIEDADMLDNENEGMLIKVPCFTECDICATYGKCWECTGIHNGDIYMACQKCIITYTLDPIEGDEPDDAEAAAIKLYGGVVPF